MLLHNTYIDLMKYACYCIIPKPRWRTITDISFQSCLLGSIKLTTNPYMLKEREYAAYVT